VVLYVSMIRTAHDVGEPVQNCWTCPVIASLGGSQRVAGVPALRRRLAETEVRSCRLARENSRLGRLKYRRSGVSQARRLPPHWGHQAGSTEGSMGRPPVPVRPGRTCDPSRARGARKQRMTGYGTGRRELLVVG
jgi:hypothetical protein